MAASTYKRGAWREALLKYLDEGLYDGSGKTRLEALAEAFVDEAFEKRDIAFFKELADRVDGKTSQPIEVAAPTDVVTALIAGAIERAAEAFSLERRPMIDVTVSEVPQNQKPPPLALAGALVEEEAATQD